MNFDDEMSEIKKAEINTNNYIKQPCVEVVEIKKVELSAKEHTGCPYIDVTFETVGSEKQSNTTRFYRTRETDTEQTKEIKLRKIKELLTHAEANFALKGEQVLKSAIGKKVKALFKEVEYLGYDKENMNKPLVKTKIEYSFSVKATDELVGNQSYFKNFLKDADRKKFEGELAKWERDTRGMAANTQPKATPAVQDDKDDFLADLENNNTELEDDGLEF